MQHDIFLYLVEKKAIREFNAGSRRFAYVLAQYYPGYLRDYRYGREFSLTDMIAGQTVSNELGGDVIYDLEVYARVGERRRKALLLDIRKVKKEAAEGTPIQVTYKSGNREKFPSVMLFARSIGCTDSTVHRWIKEGIKGANAKYKHLKIKSIKRMWINPFAGSKIVVTKIVTSKQWEKMDQADYTLDDLNEYYELYLHTESKEGLLVRLPAQKTNPYIQPPDA